MCDSSKSPFTYSQGHMTDIEGNEIGKLFVGGLSQNTNNVGLRVYFSRFGDIEDAVVMMDNKTGRSRGFGYVKFRDPEPVKLVLSTKPHWLDGKEIDAKQCNVNMKGRNRRSLKIFVGGIGLDQDAASIKTYFEKFGRVTDVNLMVDSVKQRHRGFAFIGFEDEKTVNRLINIHFLTIGNKQVEIKAMEPPNYIQKRNLASTRSSSDLSSLKDYGIKDTAQCKSGSKIRINQTIPGVNLDGNPYNYPAIQQTSYLDPTPGRLFGDQFSAGVLPVSGKINHMPWLYASGYFPMCPSFYHSCSALPYPTFQPHIMHSGFFPGSEEIWTHGVCPQQQMFLSAPPPPPPQPNQGQIGEIAGALDQSSFLSSRYQKTGEEQQQQITTEPIDVHNRRLSVSAKPSGDNFDREEVKLPASKAEAIEPNKDITCSQPFPSNPGFPCLSHFAPPCAFRLPIMEYPLYPTAGFTAFPPTVFECPGPDHNAGGFGCGVLNIPDRTSFREEESSISGPCIPVTSSQPLPKGNAKWWMPESTSNEKLAEKASRVSKTDEVTKKIGSDAEYLNSIEKSAIVSGDGLSGNFRGFRI